MKKIMLYLIIAASLIPGILAVAQYFENEKKEKETKANEKELKSKIDSLNIANTDLAKRLSELQIDNSKLSHQLAETSLSLNENIIGSNNIEVNIIPCSQTEYHFTLKNNEKLPALQAKITIQDFNEIPKCTILENDAEKIVFEDACWFKCAYQLPEFNFNSGMNLEVSKKKYTHGPKIGFLNFCVRSTTRKNSTATYYVFKYVVDKFEKSYRVYDIVDDKQVFRNEVNNLKLKSSYWNDTFYLNKLVFHRVDGK